MNILGNLEVVDSISDFTTAPELDGARSVTTATINGTVFVYVASERDDGIQVLTLDGDGQLTPVTSITDTVNTALNGALDLEVVEKAGRKFLVVTGFHDDGVSIFEIDQAGADLGHLTLRDTIYNGSTLTLDGASSVKVHEAGNRSFVVVSAYYSDSVSVFEVGSTGELTSIDQVDDADVASYRLNGASGLSIHAIGNKTFLYALGTEERGLSVFEISDSGALTHVTDVSGLHNNSGSYSDLIAGEFQGQDYLIVPDWSNGHFLVYSLAGNGVPTLTHNFDAYAGTGNTVYYNYTAEIITIDGVNFIVSQSAIADSVDIFTLDDNGIMSHVQSVSSTDLNGARDVEHVVIDGRHFILATAFDGDRISVVEIGNGDEVITGTGADDRIVGLAGDDDIIGRGGNDLILAGAGDDVVSGRKGNDTLFGGAGTDVLVGGNGDDILNGGDGMDFLLGGGGIDTLSYAGSDAGVRVNLETGSASGGDADGDYFSSIENIFGSSNDDTLDGDRGANDIDGGDGRDFITGGRGRDELSGGEGRDVVEGNEGGDRLFLDGGNDIGRGGAGNDRIVGGKGSDRIYGDSGNDTLFGSQGKDQLDGGTGDDDMTGGQHEDVFIFGNGFGSDTINDFSTVDDRIDLSGNSSLNSFAQVQASSFEFGGNTVIADGANSIQLLGVSKSDLTADDFIF